MKKIFLAILLIFSAGCSHVVVDSNLPVNDAIYVNQPPDVYQDVQSRLVVVDVEYFGADRMEHSGQIVVNKALEQDIRDLFAIIKKERFPIESVIPIAHPKIQQKGKYGLSSDTNNTSAYAWRPIVNSSALSLHSLGLAVDINPRKNPYIKGDTVIPKGAKYDLNDPQTLLPNSSIVNAFKDLGWEWGGDWNNGTRDYMHFQKIPLSIKNWVKKYR